MTISRAQMYRQLYQMGGQGIMQLGNGQEEPIFPRLETLSQNLGQAEQTLGAPSNDQFNASSITTAITGRSQMNIGGRMGYQEGDMAMMQPEGIMNAMPQEAGGMQPPMQGQIGEGDNALLTIIQLLIEQGVPPEQAQELARQILQVFAQGGEPAVEEFANQLEQEEQVQMMAGGGIAGYAQRQGYGFGSFVKGIVGGAASAVKGVANAVKSVAKSPIGKIALTVAAGYFLGPAGGMFGGSGLGASLTSNAFLAGAINAGAANLLVQGITTGKINPKEALLASALGGVGGYLSPGSTGVPSASGTVDAFGNITSTSASGNVITTSPASPLASNLNQNIAPTMGLTIPGDVNQLASVSNPLITPSVSYPGLSTTSPLLGSSDMVPKPGFFETASAVAKDPSLSGIKSLAQQGLSSLYDTTRENIVPLGLGFTAGASIRPQAANESDEDYQKYLANRNAEVARFEDLYRTGIRGVQAANGGRIGYEGGSMPMGEPRRNPAGIMELDYRAKGGFVPPIGIKEKADDIPAMLSNNEFVFTADAVRNAGGGNVNKGAQRMYGLMKQLEAGGVV